MNDIRLVAMPWLPVYTPSLALGTLQTILMRAGLPCDSVYGNVRFAGRVGLDVVRLLEVAERVDQFGDWVFSHALFSRRWDDRSALFVRERERALKTCGFIRDLLLHHGLPGLPELFESLVTEAEAFLDEFASELLRSSPRIVGCTTMAGQHCAALALLKRIKETVPQVTTLLGGPNCASTMGRVTFDRFPFVDCLVQGEADDLVVSLCQHLLQDRTRRPESALLGDHVYGPWDRDASSQVGAKRDRVVPELGQGPPPEYGDYYRELDRSGLGPYVRRLAMLEGSRGCWWGRRNQCRFCGLPARSLEYRTKPARSVALEMSEMRRRYGVSDFVMVDSSLHPAWVGPLASEIGKRRELDGVSIFWETRSSLKRSHIARLGAAGATLLQSGIETLDDRLLRLMRKGIDTLQNVAFLRNCRELGVQALWNFLWGVPGDRDEWYREMATLVPVIEHLQPPTNIGPVRLLRFSPFVTNAADHGLVLAPLRSYADIYPFGPRDLADLAYTFERVVPEGQARSADEAVRLAIERHPWVIACVEALSRWTRSFWGKARAVLEVRSTGRGMVVHDTRACAEQAESPLSRIEEKLLRRCRVPVSAGAAIVSLAGARGDPAPADVEGVLGTLERRKWVVRVNDRLLSVVVQGGPRCASELADISVFTCKEHEIITSWADRSLLRSLPKEGSRLRDAILELFPPRG